jgi:hypothetical protein
MLRLIALSPTRSVLRSLVIAVPYFLNGLFSSEPTASSLRHPKGAA